MKVELKIIPVFVLFLFYSAYQVYAASFQGLGDLPGGAVNSVAYSVSSDGSTVVGRGYTVHANEAFRWTSGDGMVGLGVLGSPMYSTARGVSANGAIVAGTSTNSYGYNEAFRWTASSGMVGLGDLPGGTFASYAYAVSADGNVIVGYSASESGIYIVNEAFRWTISGGMEGLGSLGSLPGDTFASYAYSVSADGDVVVGISGSQDGAQAFRWTISGGMEGLGDLPGGTFYSNAQGVSADGSTVIGRSNSLSGDEAFRWTYSSGMVGLGDLPGGSFFSEALGVSADGSIIVGRSKTTSGDEAFIWDSTNGIQSLADVLTSQFGLNLMGWSLTYAHCISPNGQTIVGYGTNPDGDIEAWIANINPVSVPGPVPIPGVLWLLLDP